MVRERESLGEYAIRFRKRARVTFSVSLATALSGHVKDEVAGIGRPTRTGDPHEASVATLFPFEERMSQGFGRQLGALPILASGSHEVPWPSVVLDLIKNLYQAVDCNVEMNDSFRVNSTQPNHRLNKTCQRNRLKP